MPRKRRPLNKEHSARLKLIRPFVEFDYDLRRPLSKSAKSKIKRYYDHINALQARSNKIYRSKDKARVRRVQQMERNEVERFPGIKVAFVESSGANPVEKIRFNKRGNPVITRRYFKMDFVEFDKTALATKPDAEIQRALNENPPAFAYRIAASIYSIAATASRERLPAKIKELQTRYGMDIETRLHKDEAKAANHYWGRWLNGIIPMYVRNQTELDDFLVRDERERQARKRKRKAQRRKAKRAKDSGN